MFKEIPIGGHAGYMRAGNVNDALTSNVRPFDPAVRHRQRALSGSAPFRSWPEPAVGRLARMSRMVKLQRGERLVSRGATMSAAYLIVEGSVSACVDTERGDRFAC